MKSTLLLISLFITSLSFSQKMGFEKVLKAQPHELTVFCVPNNEHNLATLKKDNINIKYSSDTWIFINATPEWISTSKGNGNLTDFYFEIAPPVLLADTTRVHHFVDQVHSGQSPLDIPYTGKDVIVGVVDQGIDYNHPDFQNADGSTRVLRYWDHSISSPLHAPQPYGYGEWWDSTSINNGTCTSIEAGTDHGTTVAGMATGNANANGLNKGMAPECDIIIVETKLNLPNWTLTIADAVDFIFKTADSLKKPAVVNLSLGTYFGSHDGTDPAAQWIDFLLDEKPGRIVVGAAGNSGTLAPYHNGNDVTSDTNFVWLLNNPSNVYGANTIYFDLWSDMADANFSFALGADTPSPGYNFRGRTSFHDALPVTPLIQDTIYNNGNKIASVNFYCEQVGSNFHMQMWVNSIDSTSYLYRFETKGSGRYDLWTSAVFGLNNMVTNIPDVATMPDIAKYVMPDTLQSIVSSWNCSPKVVSVGEFGNRKSHVTKNMTTYIGTTDVGVISAGSSKGPTRHNIVKPDVIGAGDVSLCAGTIPTLNNPAAYGVVDSSGWHVRNGGTSMASPIIAGIAALYLERCKYASYSDFISDLHATSYTDTHTGVVPNYAAGYGKAHAFDLLLAQTLETKPTIAYESDTSVIASASTGYQWYFDGNELTGETNQSFVPDPPFGPYTVVTINNDGCWAESDPFTFAASLDEMELVEGIVFPNPSKGEFSIDAENIEKIVVYDIHGKVVNYSSLGGNSYELKSCESGSYFIAVTTNDSKFITKLILQ